MDKSDETLRMVKVEMHYKLCFTVGKIVSKNYDSAFFYKLLEDFTIIVQSFRGLYSCNEFYHYLSVCQVLW